MKEENVEGHFSQSTKDRPTRRLLLCNSAADARDVGVGWHARSICSIGLIESDRSMKVSYFLLVLVHIIRI